MGIANGCSLLISICEETNWGTKKEPKLSSYAWYYKNSDRKTHPVGQKKPNGLGIYDMSGNVWEWVQDVYNANAYSNRQRNNPINEKIGSSRVMRGGAGPTNRGSYVRLIASAAPRVTGDRDLGFRLAKTP